ncbi:MAG TPA: NAD(P)H-binding protein [Caulobacter sp.]|nr:NAD(P)H-binding protein [Caulobacter sp.]
MADTILVTGATGKTGQRLVPLIEQNGMTVRAVSRKPGAGQAAFDWDTRASHASALTGVDAIYLIPPAMIEDPAPVVAPFLAAAKDAGVQNVVMVSSMGAAFPAEAPDSGRRRLEALVRGSGLDWTILRPSGFMQNFSEGFLLPAVRNGAIPNPAGDGKVAMVDAGDIAAVAAAVLVEGERHAGQVYDVTGPSLISFPEIAEIITRETGRPVLARSMTSAQFLAMLEGAGVPPDYAAILLRDQEAIRDGAAAAVSDTVARLVGRPAISFVDYAAAAGAWR